MDQDVAEAYHLWPIDIRVPAFQFRSGLACDSELLNHRTANYLGFLERFEVDAREEIGNVVRGFDDVA